MRPVNRSARLAVLITALGFLAACGSTASTTATPTPTPATPQAVATPTANPYGCFTPQQGPDSFNTPVTYTALPDGLKYADITVGCGATVNKGDQVAIQYTGWLTNGQTFDTSRQSGRQPFVFTAGGTDTVPGFSEGVIGMKVGGKRRLEIPGNLGYGASPPSGSNIPPNATLIFDIEMLAVQPATSPTP